VTVDPDDAELCKEYLGELTDVVKFEQCQSLMSGVTVSIEDQGNQSGVLSYLYKAEPVISINYAPDSASYELSLDGVKILLDDAAALELEDTTPLRQLSGAIRLSTSFDAQNPNTGKVSLDVTRALSMVSLEGVDSLSFAPGTILSIETRGRDGNGVMEMNMGALSIASSNNMGERSGFNMAGLTGRAELTKQGSVLKVSNFGLAQGPLTVTIESAEILRVAMENLGFTINEVNGEIFLDTNLNLSLFQVIQEFSVSTAGITESERTRNVEFMAAAGTTLLRQIASTKITRGGPFVINLVETSDTSSITTSIVAEEGQCIGDDGDDLNGAYDIVACAE